MAAPHTLDESEHIAPASTAGSAPMRFAADQVVFELEALSCFYGSFRAVRDISLQVPKNRITAIIGPSGCGKSTLLRSFNRMNDLVDTAHIEGRILYHGVDLYADAVDPVEVRRRIGMVFQKPNPFPKSIYDNVAFGPRVAGYAGDMDELVERSLRRAAIWDEVKDKLRTPGTALSGGQQQRLCIARAIAVEPDVILMDEPCSALDPIATLKIEELMRELKQNYTIVIVTHNMQQAARASDVTAFLTMGEDRAGYLVEMAPTDELFTRPAQRITEDYITGRFG
jgi:phosphate transport system ATP-binding protein